MKASAKNEFAFFHGQLNFTSLRVVQYVNVGKFSWSWIPGSKSRIRISFCVGSLTVVQCASNKSTKMRKCPMHMQSCCFFAHESKCFLTFSMRWLLPRLLLLWKLIKNYTVSRLPYKTTVIENALYFALPKALVSLASEPSDRKSPKLKLIAISGPHSRWQ